MKKTIRLILLAVVLTAGCSLEACEINSMQPQEQENRS